MPANFFLTFLILVINHFLISAQNLKDKIQYKLIIGSTGKSGGIYIYDFNVLTGKLNYKSEVKGKAVENPSYLTVSSDQNYVYSVCKGEKGKDGVSAFALDRVNGKLSFINTVSCGGTTPAYVEINKKNNYVFVGNFGSGSFAAIPVKKDGSLNDNIQVISNKGSSVDKLRQDKPHVHCTVLSPDNRYLFVTDLGTDKVYSYKLDLTGSPHPINMQDTSSINAKPGTGPRHLTFHPNGKYAYVIHELGGLITAYDYSEGKLKVKQTVSIVPGNFAGEVRAADIHVSPDGQFLYGSNRGDADEIVIYKIDKKGKLSFIGRQSTLGKGPRNFVIDPTGNFLLAANQMSNDIFVFQRNKKTGLLTPTGGRIEAEGPACLKFFSSPQENTSDSLFTLSDKKVSITIDAKSGSRITSLKLNGNEVLAIQPYNNNYGSSLRLSPQGKWKNTEELNHLTYNVTSFDKSNLRLESVDDRTHGFKFSNQFRLNSSESSIDITYAITNISDDVQEVAPWEVTRVPTGGIAFFPKGVANDIPKSNTIRPVMAVKDTISMIWYSYDTSQLSAQKLAMDGSEGWLGYVNNGVIFVKKFPVIQPDQEAPGEKNVELYVNKEKTFIELENQGIYCKLSKGDSLTYNVKWYIDVLPRSIEAEVANRRLIEYARRIANKNK